MPPPRYEEIDCKQALNKVEGMPFRWSLNPYRGCRHACVYCFARSTHGYFGLDAGEDFSDIIFVKRNVAAALDAQLARRSWKREQVAIGTATDPYQPAEGKYRLTRACLEVLARRRTPASIVTKGTLVVRDIDLLVELSERGGLTVCHSLPTVNEEIWRRTEPGTPPPRQRLRALERLRAAGLRAGVLMAPLLPGLSARPDEIERTAAAAADHGASFIGGIALHLGPAVREHYFSFLEREYPHLLAEYERLYPTRYAPRWLQDEVLGHVHDQRRRYDLDESHRAPRASDPEPEQLRLGL